MAQRNKTEPRPPDSHLTPFLPSWRFSDWVPQRQPGENGGRKPSPVSRLWFPNPFNHVQTVIPCCLPYKQTHTHTHNFCTILPLKQISVPKTKFKKYCLIPYFDLSMLYVQQETRPCFKDLLPNTEKAFFSSINMIWNWWGWVESEFMQQDSHVAGTPFTEECLTVVLKLLCTSRSPGELVKVHISGSTPAFLMQKGESGDQEFSAGS